MAQTWIFVPIFWWHRQLKYQGSTVQFFRFCTESPTNGQRNWILRRQWPTIFQILAVTKRTKLSSHLPKTLRPKMMYDEIIWDVAHVIFDALGLWFGKMDRMFFDILEIREKTGVRKTEHFCIIYWFRGHQYSKHPGNSKIREFRGITVQPWNLCYLCANIWICENFDCHLLVKF